MKRNILYIGAALMMFGCTSEENLSDSTPTGEEKTPLHIEASIGTGESLTRAVNKQFETGDQLLVYLRHTTGGTQGNYGVTTADQAPRLVTLTKGSTTMTSAAADQVWETSDLTASYTSTANATVTALYWDDFSDSSTPATDLRTTGHGLQSYYGYCYNGGAANITAGAELSEAAGTLGWTIPTNQSTAATVVKNADLLWSAEQPTVTYAHSNQRENPTPTHGILSIPFTHAMSEVTVTVNASDGFTAASLPLENTVLTLNAMNTVASLTAPTGTVTSTTPTAITMYAETYNTSTPLTRNFTAIVAPGTPLTVGAKLLDITDVEDNNYTVTITTNNLTTSQWNENSIHTGTNVGTDWIKTLPGVNYHITITVKKTEIQTHATLRDWTTMNATGTGDINYTDDATEPVMDDADVSGITEVAVSTIDKNLFADNSTFSLFTLKSTDANGTAASRTNAAYTYATVAEFQDNAGDANDEWVNTPAIYWPNGTDRYYFRALAQFNGLNSSRNDIESVGTFDSDKGVSVRQGTMAQGSDILWGETAKHKGSATGTTYERSQAIPPRTGAVPIAFEHAMSKVTIQLLTVAGDPSLLTSEAVDLTGATIAVTNLYTSGTITIENGTITYTDADKNSEVTDLTQAAIPTQAAPISELITIPQTITDASRLVITLADGTTYSLQLNQCLDTSDDEIDEWERGKHYTYTVTLKKEQITFRAMVKEWTRVTGSGNANLEWD